ncbi:RDD family protein [Actinoplanes sp. NPDC049802]|uniref:RDD family protein n=1 Tax=Actinoplanes sp. NPDC049802 TaxID=3154742 RepID=UPI0033F2B06C
MSYPPPPPNDPYGNQVPPPPPYGGAPYGGAGAYGAPAVNYANWGQRVGAYLIDNIIVLPFGILGATLGQDTENGVVTYNALYWIFQLLSLAVWGYNRWFQAGKTGQSWGRKALGITLVDANVGQPIGAGKAFLRDLAHFIDTIICFIGFLFPLWDAKRQTLADKIVSTVVIR